MKKLKIDVFDEKSNRIGSFEVEAPDNVKAIKKVLEGKVNSSVLISCDDGSFTDNGVFIPVCFTLVDK